jgi:four helix bundle protein
MNKWTDLNERFIDFTLMSLKISDRLPKSYAGNHIAGQLIRSSTAPALQYGEVQGAESKADFIHKFKIGLKELRESQNCMKIIQKMNWLTEQEISPAIKECNELISISVKSIQTAQKSIPSKNTPQ